MWIFFAACLISSRGRHRREQAFFGGDWRLLPANQSADAASISPSSPSPLALLRGVRVCSDINDCWGDGSGIYVVRLTLDRAEWCALSRRRLCRSCWEWALGDEGHREHSEPVILRLNWVFFSSFFFFFFFLWTSQLRFALLSRTEAVCFAVDQSRELICVKIRRPHIVDRLYVARSLVIGAAHLMGIQTPSTVAGTMFSKSGKFTVYTNLIGVCHWKHKAYEITFWRLRNALTKQMNWEKKSSGFLRFCRDFFWPCMNFDYQISLSTPIDRWVTLEMIESCRFDHVGDAFKDPLDVETRFCATMQDAPGRDGICLQTVFRAKG